MKKGSLSKYCKLGAVLLIDLIPAWIIIVWLTNGFDINTDFVGLMMMVIILFFLVFNVWALIIYALTKQIRKLWLRDVLFYLLLLLYLIVPGYLMLM
jgi:hypothetical protein